MHTNIYLSELGLYLLDLRALPLSYYCPGKRLCFIIIFTFAKEVMCLFVSRITEKLLAQFS